MNIPRIHAMTLAWHSTINSSRVSTIRKEYNAISNDRELSPAAYPPKLIRRMPRNNAGHGREMGLKLSGFFLFFLSLKKAYRLLCIMQDLLSQVFLKRVKVVFRIAFSSVRGWKIEQREKTPLRFHQERERFRWASMNASQIPRDRLFLKAKLPDIYTYFKTLK